MSKTCPIRTLSSERQAAEVRRRTDHYLDLLEDCCADRPVSPRSRSRLAECLGETAVHFLPRYVEVNHAALHFQARYRRASIAVFALASGALIVVAAQHVFHGPHWMVGLEVAAIATVLILFHLGNRFGWHRHWVDYRFLAERLRTAFFVAFISGRTGADDELHWSDRLIERSWCLEEVETLWIARPRFEAPPPEAIPALQAFMQRAWLGPQRDFHERKKHGSLRVHERISRASETFFWLTFVAAVLHLSPHGWLHAVRLDALLTPARLTFAVIALPALGTASSGLRGHFEFKKQSVRSDVMARYLVHLEAKLAAVKDLESLYHVVWETEHLMLQENAGWHLNTGLKPIEVEV